MSGDVEWTALPSGIFTVHGGSSGTSTNDAQGAQSANTLITTNNTGTSIVGTPGRVTLDNSSGAVKDSATGLPIASFTNFPCDVIM